MFSVKDKLPEIDCLVSEPVLFLYDGKRYAGKYHINGWFYSFGDNSIVVPGPTIARNGKTISTAVTHWEYVDLATDIGERVPDNCRQRLQKEGKAYPRSSCAVCGSLLSPNSQWKKCDELLNSNAVKS